MIMPLTRDVELAAAGGFSLHYSDNESGSRAAATVRRMVSEAGWPRQGFADAPALCEGSSVRAYSLPDRLRDAVNVLAPVCHVS
jgi:hypothetical protein